VTGANVWVLKLPPVSSLPGVTARGDNTPGPGVYDPTHIQIIRGRMWGRSTYV